MAGLSLAYAPLRSHTGDATVTREMCTCSPRPKQSRPPKIPSVETHPHLRHRRDHLQPSQVLEDLQEGLVRVDKAVPAQLARLVHAEIQGGVSAEGAVEEA